MPANVDKNTNIPSRNLPPYLSQLLAYCSGHLLDTSFNEFLTQIDNPLITSYLTQTNQLLTGLLRYQSHPYQRPSCTIPAFYRAGSTTIKHYGITLSQQAPIIFIVPSLINRSYIVDINTERSVAQYLVEQGYRVFVVDWGQPATAERHFSITNYICQRLIPGLQTIYQHYRQPVHLIGYRLGGLLSIALSQLIPHHIRTVAVFACPWDFSAYSDAFRQLMHQTIQQHLAVTGQVTAYPGIFLQSLFEHLQLEQVIHKFTNFAALAMNDPAVIDFVMIEDWVNDCPPLTAKVAQTCLQKWFCDNQPMLQQWQVNQQPIRLTQITQPFYTVASQTDKIVPLQATLPLQRVPQSKTVLTQLGHVGIMTSRRAKTEIWYPYSQWLQHYL